MFDYADIKALAERLGRPVDDLLAMARVNDPFWAGAPWRARDGAWFRDIWERFDFAHGAHLQRIHYVLVSAEEPVSKPDGKPYRNTQKDRTLLIRGGLAARYLDLVPAGAFADRRNDPPRIYDFGPGSRPDTWTYPGGSIGNLQVPGFPFLPEVYTDDFLGEQDYLVEVWIEKSTQNDWLIPLCRANGANLVVGVGELSEIACRQLVRRIEQTGKPARIIYISDFDPGGRSMPLAVARKTEFYLQKWGVEADVRLWPVILTEAQCQAYALPRTPIKATERRKDHFEERFGIGATELDALEALHPGDARRIVEREITRYLDPTLKDRVREAEVNLKVRLGKIEHEVEWTYRDEIARLRSELGSINDQIRAAAPEEALAALGLRVEDLMQRMAQDLEDKRPVPDEDTVPKARPAEEPEEEPLFDSRRDYLTQLDHYHAWQRR